MRSPDARGRRRQAYHHGDLRRSLVAAALELLVEQNWSFSLREVARRAGVSHNAPYNHFADKEELLTAVAVVGFTTLREQMLAAIAGIASAESALVESAKVYVKFGVENPAHYRLMFGSTLATAGGDLPEALISAASATRGVLEEIVHRGAQTGIFTPSPDDEAQVRDAVISAWSAVHGLTMLTIDGRFQLSAAATDAVVQTVAKTVCYGLVRR